MIEMLNNMIENVRNFGLERVFKRYYSLYRAEVVSNADPKKRGRITIKVPQLFGDFTLPQMAEPIDFRNSANGKGEFFPPDNKDWVYVMFEGGDQRFPLYMGGWYGAADLDPVFTHTDKGVPLTRGYKDKFGSYWIFDQTPGKERIKLLIPGENHIEMSVETGKERIRIFNKDQDMVFDRDGIRITDKFKNQIDMKSGGVDENVVADHNVKIAANEKITTGGNRAEDVTGNDKKTVGGNMDLTVTGNCNITVNGVTKLTCPDVQLNGNASGITTANSHMNVIDFITGVPVLPSTTVKGDV
jgi:hypothetical protein